MQKQIGITTDTGTVYEPVYRGNWWQEIWPNSAVSTAVFIGTGQSFSVTILEPSELVTKLVFREDSFDATTRIRRGRFYESAGNSSVEIVASHSILARGSPGLPQAALHKFLSMPAKPESKLVAIGAEDSLWRILGAERISTGEWLVTLKARGALGILPEVDADKIPELGRSQVVKAIDHVVDVAHRETPGSIVDVARNTAALLMAVYAAELEADAEKKMKILGEDLGDVCKHFKNPTNQKLNKQAVVIATGQILARLHPRNKPNEQQRHGLRPIAEEDGVFAVNAIGLLLNEFKWTRETA